MADYTTPHRFLETILSGPIDGRRRLYGRLGLAARDPVEELLSSALEFERAEAGSLDRFLAWFNTGEVEIKRDPSAPNVISILGSKIDNIYDLDEALPSPHDDLASEHDPEKWRPVFGKDHAPTKTTP